jgi:hypothetical protein
MSTSWQVGLMICRRRQIIADEGRPSMMSARLGRSGQEPWAGPPFHFLQTGDVQR